MEPEQRIVVRTKMLREGLSRLGLVGHARNRHAIDVIWLDANADDPAREQIHGDQDPAVLVKLVLKILTAVRFMRATDRHGKI
jgi:hypothetical protein